MPKLAVSYCDQTPGCATHSSLTTPGSAILLGAGKISTLDVLLLRGVPVKGLGGDLAFVTEDCSLLGVVLLTLKRRGLMLKLVVGGVFADTISFGLGVGC